jgi:hypothetical protein
MRNRLIRAAALAIGIALLVAVAAAARSKDAVRVEKVEAGNLILTDAGGISPQKLPRHKQVPITAQLHATIATKDGSHPPAARQLNIDFDRTLQVDAKGLPSCSAGKLEAQTTAGAKRACPGAIVGSGTAEVEVAFPEQKPFTATGPLIAFNGGVHGATTLFFIHAYLNVPAPTAVVVETRITKESKGRYDMHTVTRIPPIAGGAGSPIGFELKLGRKYSYKGKSKSYLTASCPTGVYFTHGHVDFSDGTVLHVTHPLPCTPEG